jgi:hypothetical protein
MEQPPDHTSPEFSTAKSWLAIHQQEVDQHNQAHGITDRVHNRSVPDEVWDTLVDQARS